ncbi:MAG: uracil-DNA glycosylase [Gemmatimonadota bacterium]|nr:uracil-DNA glycosylase [Gemmatimonadota bacterium]
MASSRDPDLEGTRPQDPLPAPALAELPMGEALSGELAELEVRITTCRRCPRLVEWRERKAEEKRRAFEDETYWGRPVPGWGNPDARLLVVGLAPAAHGANRTGRYFTGDESGRWLYRALHRFGYASQPESVARGDGLELSDCFVTGAVRCAPPDNRPTPEERRSCRPYLEAEIDLLTEVEVIVALGKFAYDHVLRIFRDRGHPVPSPKPPFAHTREVEPGPDVPRLIASYHPSQQNTFTGVLTEAMFDDVFRRARERIEGG